MKKPGALRNGAPFKDWDLPSALTQVRAKLKPQADADRQFVKVLGAVLEYGLAAVEAASTVIMPFGWFQRWGGWWGGKASFASITHKKAGRGWHHHSRAPHRRSMGPGG